MAIIRSGYSNYRRPSGRGYAKARALVLAAARSNGAGCYFCGWRETADDPFEARHIKRIEDGGSVGDPNNIAAAHRSYNRRGGAPRR